MIIEKLRVTWTQQGFDFESRSYKIHLRISMIDPLLPKTTLRFKTCIRIVNGTVLMPSLLGLFGKRYTKLIGVSWNSINTMSDHTMRLATSPEQLQSRDIFVTERCDQLVDELRRLDQLLHLLLRRLPVS